MDSIKEGAREQRAKEIAEALATGRLEGLEPSSGATTIFQQYIDGDLTAEQMLAVLDEYADREYDLYVCPMAELNDIRPFRDGNGRITFAA